MASDTCVPNTDRVPIQYVHGKGMESHFAFPNNPKAQLKKHIAKDINTNLKYISEELHQDYCKAKLSGTGLETMAEQNGWTLVELVEDANRQIEERKAMPNAIDAHRCLASILSNLAPNESPEELAARLRNLVDTKMDAAVQLLADRLADPNPLNRRNPEGYIYLRNQDPNKKKSQKGEN